MTNAVCQQGTCTGTEPAPSGTECFLVPGLEKCYTPGQCMNFGGFSFCIPGTPKTCEQPADPCKGAFCNPQTGNCEVGDKCFTFSGCEVCNAGVCSPVNIGGACANAEGDFNPCTTDDRCTVLSVGSSLPHIAASAGVPGGLAAALTDAQQVLEGRALCMGGAGVGPTPTATLPTGPTSTPTEGATPTPTEGATPTPTEGATCAGDCNNDAEVTVNELITMVNIALGNANVSTCVNGDASGDGEITVNEIVSAVNRALSGCV